MGTVPVFPISAELLIGVIGPGTEETGALADDVISPISREFCWESEAAAFLDSASTEDSTNGSSIDADGAEDGPADEPATGC